MRIVLFTAGTVGAGHVAHGVAIQRGLSRAGYKGEFRVFGPQNDFPISGTSNYEPIPIDPEKVTDPFRAPVTELARMLAEFSPDLLLVDMFWAPMMYLLPLPDCQHWLLVRKARDNWLIGDEFVPFDPSLYQRIIEFEPIGLDACTHQLEPIVIANPDECQPPTALREKLDITTDTRLAVVTHAGNRGELAEIPVDEPAGTHIERFDLYNPEAPFPLAEWLGGADAIHCGGGYNSFWESKWLGYHDRTHFTGFKRDIDDQQWRIDTCADYVMKENGADQLARWIMEG